MDASGEVTNARRHLCIPVTGSVKAQVEPLRRTWDPIMAAVVPAHVTVTYPEESDDDALLLKRAASYAELHGAFMLRLGEIFGEDDGRGGVFFAVQDVEKEWTQVREHLLAPPFRPMDLPPHVTVVHPRTSPDGAACLAELAGFRLDAEFTVNELLFTETSAETFSVLRRFALRRP